MESDQVEPRQNIHRAAEVKRFRLTLAYDGTEFVAEPGDVTSLPSGHDAWVIGNEPVVVVDWYGASNYAKAG